MAARLRRRWLDAAVLPHIYVEQSPLTVPVPLRGQIKRPDYIVGIPGVGMVAFDVKAKTIYPEGLIFEVDEVRKLRSFARLFHCTVYFACLNPEGGVRLGVCYLRSLRHNLYTNTSASCLTLNLGPRSGCLYRFWELVGRLSQVPLR
ncbi:MAG: hypothetical protein J0H40_17215 [Rhizobiales bacterium]|nr:hypothetical protein [Hyphomicrobiales bacterium]